jgi:hypothetical protein
VSITRAYFAEQVSCVNTRRQRVFNVIFSRSIDILTGRDDGELQGLHVAEDVGLCILNVNANFPLKIAP